jgi:hypothetical protein
MRVVARKKQLLLPTVDKVEKVIAYPQPRKSKAQAPKKFELLHHPFDLAFRGRINKWLDWLLEARGLKFNRFLNSESVELLQLYFFPHGVKNKWLNQDEVLVKTEIPYKKKLKNRLVESLIMIWSAVKKA